MMSKCMSEDIANFLSNAVIVKFVLNVMSFRIFDNDRWFLVSLYILGTEHMLPVSVFQS